MTLLGQAEQKARDTDVCALYLAPPDTLKSNKRITAWLLRHLLGEEHMKK